VYSSKQALKVIDAIAFDCIVLNCSLSTADTQNIIGNIAKYRKDITPQLIINSSHLLSDQHYAQVNQSLTNLIIKEANSNERLLDQVLLSLHQEIESLPTKQRKIIEHLYHGNNFFEGHTLLLVDDDLRNTFALSTVLEQKGLNVIIAENGLKALELLQEKPEIEMVLMDIMMPIMDGYEAIKEIRNLAKFQSLPIVALTAKAMEEDRVKCLQAGANFYMNKPVNTSELFILLKVLIAKEDMNKGMDRKKPNLNTLMNITQYL
jgi:CheY-like chemotaxis protein